MMMDVQKLTAQGDINLQGGQGYLGFNATRPTVVSGNGGAAPLGGAGGMGGGGSATDGVSPGGGGGGGSQGSTAGARGQVWIEF